MRSEAPSAVTSPRQLLIVVLWMTGTLLSFSVMAIAIRAPVGIVEHR